MHRFSDEGGLVVRHNKTDDDFESKPGVADALDVEECWMRVLSLFLHPPRGGATGFGGNRRHTAVVVVDVEGDVAQDGNSHAVECLETERQNRRNDEEDGDT